MKKILLALLTGALLALGACSTGEALSDSTGKSAGGPVEKTTAAAAPAPTPAPEPAAEEPFETDDKEIFRVALEMVLAEIPAADREDLCSIVEGIGGVDLAVTGLRAGFEAEVGTSVAFHDDVAAEVVTEWCEVAPVEDEPAPSGDYGDFSGTGFTYDDGLSISLTGLAPFEPSDTAAYFEMPAYVQFIVTIENGTPTPYDPAGFYATLSSGGAEGDQVFDYENGMNGSPMTSVLPGDSVSFPIAFGINDAADLVFEATPSWEHDPSLFVGGL